MRVAVGTYAAGWLPGTVAGLGRGRRCWLRTSVTSQSLDHRCWWRKSAPLMKAGGIRGVAARRPAAVASEWGAMRCRRLGCRGGVSESRAAVMREEKRAKDEYRTRSHRGLHPSGARRLLGSVCMRNRWMSPRVSNLVCVSKSRSAVVEQEKRAIDEDLGASTRRSEATRSRGAVLLCAAAATDPRVIAAGRTGAV
jgi:hypothetical protein